MVATRRWSIISLIGLLVAGLMLVAVPTASADRVLQTFRAGQFVLDLAIAECRSSECPIKVRLRTGGRVINRVTLPVAASSQRATAEPVDTIWGADAGRKAWATGKENNYVSTAARLLQLDPRTPALLASQRYGFEHVKRNHLLLGRAPVSSSLLEGGKRARGRPGAPRKSWASPGATGQEVAYISTASSTPTRTRPSASM